MTSEGYLDLVCRARAGDRAAMDRLLEAVRPDLQRHAGRYAQPAHADASASDLVQQTTIRAWQKIGLFHAAGDDAQALAQFRAWAVQILHRLGLNQLRHRAAARRQPQGELLSLAGRPAGGPAAAAFDPASDQSTPSAHVGQAEENERLRDALARVPELDRTIVRLRFYEGLSLRQIAARLQLSQDKVREICHRALRRLEQELGPGR